MHSFWLEGVSTPVLHKMLQELRAEGNSVAAEIPGTSITGNKYLVRGSGITATVQYDPIHMRAAVTILEKPFLVSNSYIESRVRESLQAARA